LRLPKQTKRPVVHSNTWPLHSSPTFPSLPYLLDPTAMPHSVNHSTSTAAKMSRPSSTSSNAFPRQAGTALLSPEKVGEQLSPSPSQFSFASSPHSVQEAEAEARNRAQSNAASNGLRPMTSTSRSRAQFYEDQFSYKDSIASSARERVSKDAPIVAELRTNVIVSLTAGRALIMFPQITNLV